MRKIFIVIVLFVVTSCDNEKYTFNADPKCEEINKGLLPNTIILFDSEGLLDQEQYLSSPSKKLKDILLADSSFKEAIKEKYNFIIVNNKCEESKSLLNKYGIKAYPTVLITSFLGDEVNRIVGITSIENIKSKALNRPSVNSKIRKEYFAQYPEDTVAKSRIRQIADFWDVKSSNIDILGKKVYDHYYIDLNSTGSFTVGDGYEIITKFRAGIIANQYDIASFDYYITNDNKIVFRKISAENENGFLMDSLQYNEQEFDISILNVNEIEIYNSEHKMYLVRDTLNTWKK